MHVIKLDKHFGTNALPEQAPHICLGGHSLVNLSVRLVSRIHGDYVKITVIHCNFVETTKCNFWKIMMDHHNFDTSTVKSKICLVFKLL